MTQVDVQQKPKVIEGIDIRFDKTTKVYYVTLTTDAFIRGKHENDLFLVWLLSRWEDETIVFSFTQEGWGGLVENYITFLNAIKICSATTIARVDHMHESVTTLAVLACDDIVVSDFGMLQLDPITDKDGSTRLTRQLEVAADFAFYLMENGVERGLISREEYIAVRDGSVVVLTPGVLRERTK